MASSKERPCPLGGSSMRLNEVASSASPQQLNPRGLSTEQPEPVSRSDTPTIPQSRQPHSPLLEQGSSLHSQSGVELSPTALHPILRPRTLHSSTSSAISPEPRADPATSPSGATSEQHEFFRGGKGRGVRDSTLNGAYMSVHRSRPSGIVPKPQMLACCLAKLSAGLCQIDRSPFEGARTVNELMAHLSHHVEIGHISGVVIEQLRRAMPSRRNKAAEQEFWRNAICLIFPLYGLLEHATALCPDQGKPLLGDPRQEEWLKAQQTEFFRSAATDFLALSPQFCQSYTLERLRYANLGELLQLQGWIEYSRRLDPLYPAPITPSYEGQTVPQMMEGWGCTPLTELEMNLPPPTTDLIAHTPNLPLATFVNAQQAASQFSPASTITRPGAPTPESAALTAPASLDSSSFPRPNTPRRSTRDRGIYCDHCNEGPVGAWQFYCPTCRRPLIERTSPARDQIDAQPASLAPFTHIPPIPRRASKRPAPDSADPPVRMQPPAPPAPGKGGRGDGFDGDFQVRRPSGGKARRSV